MLLRRIHCMYIGLAFHSLSEVDDDHQMDALLESVHVSDKVPSLSRHLHDSNVARLHNFNVATWL